MIQTKMHIHVWTCILAKWLASKMNKWNLYKKTHFSLKAETKHINFMLGDDVYSVVNIKSDSKIFRFEKKIKY